LGANIQNLFKLSKFYNPKVEITVIRTKPPIIFSLILLVLLICILCWKKENKGN
jgi:hypothetical protein